MIEFINVTKLYQTSVRALKGVSFKIKDGEFVFIVGVSGAGKSTLTKLMMHEEKPNSGKVIVNDFDIGQMKVSEIPMLRRTMGVVFQDFRLIPSKTVYENVAFAMRVVGATQREIKKRIPKVLGLVGLANKAKRMPNELSGGEQQRVALARALVNNPAILIADEPTGNVDPEMACEIINLLLKINERGTTVIVVTHQLELVDRFKQRILCLQNGHLIRDISAKYNAKEYPEIKEKADESTAPIVIMKSNIFPDTMTKENHNNDYLNGIDPKENHGISLDMSSDINIDISAETEQNENTESESES